MLPGSFAIEEEGIIGSRLVACQGYDPISLPNPSQEDAGDGES